MTSSPDGEGGGQPKDDEWWHDDEGGEKDDKRSLALAFKDHFQPSIMTPPFFLGGGVQ